VGPRTGLETEVRGILLTLRQQHYGLKRHEGGELYKWISMSYNIYSDIKINILGGKRGV
jgi:hypothetical protein